MKTPAFVGEVKFQVGQRVHVELEEVPERERNTAEGTITRIVARFPKTPAARKIYYTVMFDDCYVKKEYRLIDGISSISCTGDCLTAL